MQNDPEFAEKRRKIDRESKRSLSQEKRDAHNERKRTHYYANKKTYLARRSNSRKLNKERENETARKHYHRTRDERLKQIYEGRDRRDPTRGIIRAINSFARGNCSVSEVIERLERADHLIDEQVKGFGITS